VPLIFQFGQTMPRTTTPKSADRLTQHQRRLLRELEEITSLLKLDYRDIRSYEPAARTPLLERMKRQFIIGEVITSYTLTDEHLNARIAQFFFGRKKSFIMLWKTKRFKVFNYHVLEELSLMAKLRFVKSISTVPKAVAADIERLNALRNGLAHAFFPENLRRSKPEWKGKNIFTIEGLRAFLEDMTKIGAFFLHLSPEELDIL
jgi:hypothetical protein